MRKADKWLLAYCPTRADKYNSRQAAVQQFLAERAASETRDGNRDLSTLRVRPSPDSIDGRRRNIMVIRRCYYELWSKA